jgi:hypothetical protein
VLAQTLITNQVRFVKRSNTPTPFTTQDTG